ncbi:TetR/AcrR family transcriptional regulator [Streptomyces sp. WZ-12]|uniref:TetR/AcrR family transcriptional regulator n=1 Tax=Streptomyces sp. WZ-12 TaxID=3030210 RepID=UPI00238120AD|nr:TetR/AcrR family transcriptional regulator [Streptomyces sp. WZ-12]
MERDERGQRILEVAGELLLAWGYRRVTIDEIARRAKVGKGTVYLHWKTKDSLLLAVVLNVKWRTQRQHLARMRSDPLEILPSRTMRSYYGDFLKEPVLRAMHTEDVDILGRLSDTAKKEFADLMALSEQVLLRYLDVLRQHGLIRSDLDVPHLQYALLSTTTGFLMSEAMLYDRAPENPKVRGDLLAETLRRMLETPAEDFRAARTETNAAARPLRYSSMEEAAVAAAPEIIALYEQLEESSATEIRRQLRE